MTRTDSGLPTVVMMGVHVLDVLVRPVERIPDGQDGQLVEDIRMTAAGTAGGTAITLAKLSANVLSAGAVGADAVGDLLVSLLNRGGVNTTHLLRRDDFPTSASVLPIRNDGSRPAFHVIGANASYSAEDAPWDAIAAADHLHLGGPEFMGGDAAARVLAFAHEHGTTTSADVLAPCDPGLLSWLAPMFPHLDHLLPNAEQIRGFVGAVDLEEGCRILLEQGVGCIAVTDGAAGAVVVDASQVVRVPAFDVTVVDTTGCGDAFSAGYIRGLMEGLTLQECATLGCATAAMVAGGLGSDFGHFDLVSVRDLCVGRSS